MERVVEVGQRTLAGACLEVPPELADHRRGRLAAAHPLAHRAQSDHVPLSEIVEVVALGGIARGRAEIAEVPESARGVVLVVSNGGLGARLVATSGGVVATGKPRSRVGEVGVVRWSASKRRIEGYFPLDDSSGALSSTHFPDG